jgi:hypothetical protein
MALAVPSKGFVAGVCRGVDGATVCRGAGDSRDGFRQPSLGLTPSMDWFCPVKMPGHKEDSKEGLGRRIGNGRLSGLPDENWPVTNFKQIR